MRKISFLIVSHGHDVYIKKLILSLRERPDVVDAEIVVVDNIGSFDVSLREFLKERCVVVVENVRKRGFSENNNIAVSVASGDTLFFLNPDTELISFDLRDLDSLEDDVLYFPELRNVDGSLQSSGRRYPSFFRQIFVFVLTFFGVKLQGVKGRDWYFAAAMICSRNFYYRIGGFEEAFPLYCEDTEICHRSNSLYGGIKVLENVKVLHHLGAEGKGRFRGKAVVSNILLRFFMLKNLIGRKGVRASH